MKTHLSLFVFLAALFSACQKHQAAGNSTLIGRWKMTEYYSDPGDGSGKWTPVPAKADTSYIQFNPNGKLQGNAYAGYVAYRVKDSITLTFAKADSTKQNFRYSIKSSILTMSPAGPIYCIEGCGQRFVKVRG